MKKIARLLVFTLLFLSALTRTALASPPIVNPQPPSSTAAPNILVSAIVTTVTSSSSVLYFEIYNQADSPILLSGWQLSFTAADGAACSSGISNSVALPAAWILSKNYLTLTNDSLANPNIADVFSLAPNWLASCSSPWLSSIQLVQNGVTEQSISLPSNPTPLSLIAGVKQKQRDNSSSSTRTLSGVFNSDYAALSSSDISTGLYSDPLYLPPADNAGLEVVEIYPHSPSCSPTDTSALCDDYVKLYNSSATPVDLSLYRLRTSYGGLSSSSSNTVNLSTVLDAHQYTLINTRNDGTPLGLTETGGYVWLEDAQGAQIYQPVIQYPDASSTTKVGWSWALNGSSWQWSSAPQPNGKNIFPPIVSVSSSSSSSLKPCAAGQERNPATNRCRSILSLSTSSLGACAAGQERNPATNRCRSVLGASTTLSPCPAGQTRNPATNRCRQDPNAAIANVQDVASQALGSPSRRWLVAGGSAAGAVGYGVWEWRHEASLFLDKIKLWPEMMRGSTSRIFRRRK